MSWVTFKSQQDGVHSSVDEKIRVLWQEYLIDILGIPLSEAQHRIEAEVHGHFHDGLLNHLETLGWHFRSATVLDLGCGTGALATALIDRDAYVIGVEPSLEWANVAHKRLANKRKLYGQIIIADGAHIPLESQSVDYIFSLQVLEHVPISQAKQIITEIGRILRPGGKAYISFENYFSFWEPHYRVRWFPYLPKWIGSIYLKMLGRNPEFLQKHIYYNSIATLMTAGLKSGLTKPTWENELAKFREPELVENFFRKQVVRLLRFLPSPIQEKIALLYVERRQVLHTTFVLELTRG